MATISQPYQVALISNDLASGETLLDVFHSLDHLQSIVNEIFQRIDTRVEDERQRIQQIKHRVNTCVKKIQQIKGSNQAITVFSTAKYPAPKTLPSYPTLLGHTSNAHPLHREINDEVIYTPGTLKESLIGNRELHNEVSTIVTRLNSVNRELERVEFIMEDDGLGSLPLEITSVGSLLLFNSSINVYRNFQTLDNLVSAGREKAVKDEIAKQLASAPVTLVSGDALPDIQGLDLLFKPQAGEMTMLALPENLPLDFIANINFAAVDLPSIAPSAYGKANYSLPQITDGGYSAGPSAKQPMSASASSSGPPPPPPSFSASAPPPPPPPLSTSMPPPPPPPPSMSMDGPPLPPAAAATATSMPPPPPAAAMAAAADGGDALSSSSGGTAMPAGLPAPDGRRMSLLDSIKGMGVTKLRKKDDSAAPVSSKPKKSEAARPLSMAEALRERLARRNDAMSGKSDKDSQRRDSAIVAEARKNVAAPPKPKPPVGKPGLASLGFATVDEDDSKRKGSNSDDDDDALPSRGRMSIPRAPIAADSDSDVSEISVESRPSPAVKGPPALVIPAVIKPSMVIAPPAPRAVAPPPGTKATSDADMFSKMMAKARPSITQRPTEDDDSNDNGDNGGDDDWD